MARLIAGADETELLRAEKAALEELLAVQENCVIEQSERLEKALCERIASEEKFQVLFEHSSEGHMILDGNSIVDCNQAAVLMLGAADKRQALGIDLRCFSPGLQPDGQTSLDKFAEMISLAGASGSHRFDWTFLRFDGRELPVELTLTRVEIGGKPLVMAEWHDLTRRKETEQALIMARDQAQTADRIKGEFLANVSHEIRTPLNGIIGMTQLTLQTELTAEQRDYLDACRFSAESLLTVINDVLDFSKMEAGKMALNPADFLLQPMLDVLLKSLAVRAHQKGLELVCEVGPDVPAVVFGDPDRLRQILVNLAGNAIKFTERGEVLVRVELDSRNEYGLTLRFSVIDTGIGIATNVKDRIFQPFTQGDGSTTRRYGGTGLGLSISQQLVAMMGGRIWFESEEEQGSAFHFTAQLGEARQAPTAAPDFGILHGVRALIVDAHATSRRILSTTLAHWGVRTEETASVESAMDMITGPRSAGAAFDVFLIDGSEEGFALTQRIGSDFQRSSSVILLLRTSELQSKSIRCSELGVRTYLVKPVGQADLYAAVLKVSGRSPAAALLDLAAAAGVVAPVADYSGLRVLLAEDNAINQRLAIRVLEQRGASVVVAGDGAEALKMLRDQRFDIVLMDIQMPKMDGLEATAAIREMEKETGRRTPIIAFTAHAMKGDRERYLRAGMDEHVTKPLDQQDLFRKIETLVGGAQYLGRDSLAT